MRTVNFFLLVVTPALGILLALLGLETARTNLLGWFLFLTGIVFTAGMVIAYCIRGDRFWESSLSGPTTHEEQGNRSFWLVTISLAAATFLPPIEYLYFPMVFSEKNWMSAAGIGLVTLGVVLFSWARGTLRNNYSGRLVVKASQTLMQSGPYHFIRHPAYASYLMMVFGISLGYASLAGILTTLVWVVPSLVYRIKVEEKLLNEHFGETYCQYARMVKRLIPGIW